MKALQSQMNPHFIFNSLNSIREMVLSEENKEASHYLSKFAQLIRITLEQSTQETVSLRATIDYLHRYIEMETVRNGFLTYEIQVGDELDQDETLVSPMFIQPFVENAIWHGVSATRKDIRVNISFRKTGDLLVCTVDDNGMGIQHSQSLKRLKGVRRRSLGIANVQDRIKLLNEKYQLRCSVTIIDKKERADLTETGTLVTIQLPYQTTES
jgi:sensor histidine kinase YesM